MNFLNKSLLYTQEIRYRLFFCILTFISTFIISFLFREELLYLLIKPLIFINFNENNINKLIFLNITEAFETYMFICLYFSILFTLKIFIFQIISFLSEALYQNEKKFITFFLINGYLLFLIIFYLIYNFLIPIIWKFFIFFQNNSLSSFDLEFIAQLSIYIYFFLTLILKLIFILLIPFIFGVAITIFEINLYKITKNRPFFLFLNLIIATIVSPPDIFSQIFITFLLTLFLEIIFIYNFIFKNYNEN